MGTDWDKELHLLRENIQRRLNMAAETIVAEEVSKILGRVKIITHRDLGQMNYDWFIERPIATDAHTAPEDAERP